jgi:magnesium transporter
MQKLSLQHPIHACVNEVHTILSIEDTIEKGLAKLRALKAIDKIVYFYVVDNDHKLVGVVPTRKLLLSDPATAISEILLGSPVQLTSDQTLADALELFEKYRLLALPVVDKEGKFLGAIDVASYMEKTFDASSPNHRREVFQMVGLSLEDGKKTTVMRDYRLRMPWLLCNMLSGVVCAIISRINEQVLGKFLLLAFFIPLVLTLSESVSMQSMTQSLQFLRRPSFNWRHAIRIGYREWKVVWLVSISSGIMVGLLSLLWKDGLMPSIIIGIGITFSVIVSALFGISIPIILHRAKLDPKIAAGPVVLMIADALTTLFYLSLATWLLL